MPQNLTLEDVKNAVAGNAVAFRSITKLQPVGGPGAKVFPPTYVGGVYAVENRRIDGQVMRCVLLDSVQSQANRLEEALLDAFLPDWREMETGGDATKCDLPLVAVHVAKHGWITSLTAPHRIHDAILRDSILNGCRFRESSIGKEIVDSRLHDATAFYKYCPTALLFGTWDSTAGEGLNSAKIPRAVVSEIIGVDIVPGVRTGSRIDPLGIVRMNATFFRKGKSGWTFDESQAEKKYLKEKKGDKKVWTANIDDALKDQAGNPIEEQSLVWGNKPSDINHGNIPPDLARYERVDQSLRLLPDILESNPVKLRYDLEAADGRMESHTRLDGQIMRIRDGAVKPGGVTMAYGLHTWTLSLSQLRRLRFPVNGEHSDGRNSACRTVLTALALYALALQHENFGYLLRSRCELVSENEVTLEVVGNSNSHAVFTIGGSEQIRKGLLDPAIKDAHDNQKVAWNAEVIRLDPTDELLELVRRSDERVTSGDVEEEGAADAGTEG